MRKTVPPSQPKFSLQRLILFFQQELWLDPAQSGRSISRGVLELLRICFILVERILSGSHALRASSLTYTTLLSLVPFLALAFSIAKGFGANDKLEPLLRNALLAQPEIAENILNYVNQTNVSALGILGLIGIFFTVVLLIGSVEKAFNEIWGVTKSRPFGQSFAYYISATIVFPLFILAASGLTATLSSKVLAAKLDLLLPLLNLMRYAFIWVAFTFIYLFLPNVRVKLLPALLGGILAGTAWLFLQWGYVHFQVGVASYNAIYGTFAALPIFLVWLYLSWVIVLLGAELVTILQNLNQERLHRQIGPMTQAERVRLALQLAVEEARRLDAGQSAIDQTELLSKLGLPAAYVRAVLESMERAGLFQSLQQGDGERTSVLRHSPDKLHLSDFLEDFDQEGQEPRALLEPELEAQLKLLKSVLKNHPANLSLRKLASLKVSQPQKT